MTIRVHTALLAAVLLASAGCTTYYKVTDPTTGNVYYTTKLEHKGSGAAQLTDARTGNKVSLQNTDVQTIKKEEFETGKNTAPVPTPAK